MSDVACCGLKAFCEDARRRAIASRAYSTRSSVDSIFGCHNTASRHAVRASKRWKLDLPSSAAALPNDTAAALAAG